MDIGRLFFCLRRHLVGIEFLREISFYESGKEFAVRSCLYGISGKINKSLVSGFLPPVVTRQFTNLQV